MKSINKLPPRAKALFNAVYDKAKQTYSDTVAIKTAMNIVATTYKPIEYVGRKSVTEKQVFDDSHESKIHGTYIDVLLGYGGMDIQAENGGLKLSDDGWNRVPSGILKGDYEHFYADKADGVYSDVDDSWEGWVPVAQKFWVDEKGLNARVELPENHPQTPIFTEMWKSGELGLSVDYAYPEEAIRYIDVDGKLIPEATEWFTTGFTFTKNPSYEKTKNEQERSD